MLEKGFSTEAKVHPVTAETWAQLDEPWPNRETCTHVGPGGTPCFGFPAQDGLCVNHVSESKREAAINEVLSSRVVDLRGLVIDSELWGMLSEGLERVAFDQAAKKQIWLGRSIFTVRPEFFGWRFWGHLECDGTRFEEGANFVAVDFEGDVSFAGASFGRPDQKTSGDFETARFKGDLVLNSATFAGEGRFYRARFAQQIDLQGTTFASVGSFEETEWATAQRLFGRVFLKDEMNLRLATFHGDLLMETEGGIVDLEDAKFADALTIRARSTKLRLEHLDLTRPSLVSLAPDSKTDDHGTPLVSTAIDFSPQPAEEGLPRVESLRNSNVLALTIASADLRNCRFQGARNLDRLSIEGQTLFAQAPKRHSRRRVVAEERAWRLARPVNTRTAFGRRIAKASEQTWRDARTPDDDPPQGGDVQPEQLARIYRGLRKSLEESKDFAGASDFYYGEMEMRLRSRSTPVSDRMIIGAYWLLSGYGLRASRSILALVVTLVAFAALFSMAGFSHPETLLGGLLHSARSAALFPQGNDVGLTRSGEVFQIVLRIVGPVLIALTALALRARIKR